MPNRSYRRMSVSTAWLRLEPRPAGRLAHFVSTCGENAGYRIFHRLDLSPGARPIKSSPKMICPSKTPAASCRIRSRTPGCSNCSVICTRISVLTPASLAVRAASRCPEQQPVIRGSSHQSVDHVAHVKQNVGSGRQLGQTRCGCSITAEDDRPVRSVQPIRKASQIRLAMDDLRHLHVPTLPYDDAAVADLNHLRGRPLAGQHATTHFVDEVAARVHRASPQDPGP